MNEAGIRRDIVAVCHRLYEDKLIAATDGNVSVRTNDLLYVTRSGICKGEMTTDDVIVVDMQGHSLSDPTKPPSSEIRMHLACYEERPDVRSVVHAHPPYAVSFTIAGVSLVEPVVPEVVLTMGTIPTVRYTTPTTNSVAEAIRPFVRRGDAFLLERHGAVTVGKDIKDAFFKMEKVEHTAHIQWLSHQLGTVQTLTDGQVERLLQLRSKFDIEGRNPLLPEQEDRI